MANCHRGRKSKPGLVEGFMQSCLPFNPCMTWLLNEIRGLEEGGDRVLTERCLSMVIERRHTHNCSLPGFAPCLDNTLKH